MGRAYLRDIADSLFVSKKTVSDDRQKIFRYADSKNKN